MIQAPARRDVRVFVSLLGPILINRSARRILMIFKVARPYFGVPGRFAVRRSDARPETPTSLPHDGECSHHDFGHSERVGAAAELERSRWLSCGS
jgi:hypothetical protein